MMSQKWTDYVHQDMTTFFDCIFYQSWQFNKLKNGNCGKKIIELKIPFSRLWKCNHCGKLGSDRVIHHWGLRSNFPYLTKEVRIKTGSTHIDEQYSEGHNAVFCISCANKIRPSLKSIREYVETTNLINKVKLTIREQKNGTN